MLTAKPSQNGGFCLPRFLLFSGKLVKAGQEATAEGEELLKER